MGLLNFFYQVWIGWSGQSHHARPRIPCDLAGRTVSLTPRAMVDAHGAPLAICSHQWLLLHLALYIAGLPSLPSPAPSPP